jgi:hypothetical protein
LQVAVLCARGHGDVVRAAVAAVSLPIHDERIVEVAERIDGLTESEQEAALAALAPSDRDEVLLVMLAQATMVEQLLGVLVAGLPSEGSASPADDPLRGAAQQVADRFSEAVQTLSWRVLRVAREAEAKNEMQAVVEQLVAEHVEVREQAETVATFLLAYEG